MAEVGEIVLVEIDWPAGLLLSSRVTLAIPSYNGAQGNDEKDGRPYKGEPTGNMGLGPRLRE